MKKLIAALMLCLVTLSVISPAHAHSGRTDRNGCHNDNKNGGRHCH
ncbi:YHYH domain-containing protein [Oligella sp. HMSC09E12]